MTFVEVHELYRAVRQRVVAFAGERAFGEINVPPPMQDDDELSFLRLVVWCYVLVQESGRIPLRFLGQLGPKPETSVVRDIASLRTWAAHNLDPSKDSDADRLKRSWVWLKSACGVHRPSGAEQWQACFARLCGSAGGLLHAALAASESLDHEVDGPRNVEELRRRVDRDWEAYRFDKFVTDAAAKLGFDAVDATAFRKNRLDAWRKVVACAREESIDKVLVLRIESDLLDLLGRALPLSATEVLERATLSNQELAALMLAIRSKAPISHHELICILEELAGSLDPVHTSPVGAATVTVPTRESTPQRE